MDGWMEDCEVANDSMLFVRSLGWESEPCALYVLRVDLATVPPLPWRLAMTKHINASIFRPTRKRQWPVLKDHSTAYDKSDMGVV